MIAAGLCLMGGCFSQNADGSPAEVYWPASVVAIPSSPVATAVFEHLDIGTGVELADIRVHSRNAYYSGVTSFFYADGNDKRIYNAYGMDNYLTLTSRRGGGDVESRLFVSLPAEVVLDIDANSARFSDTNVSVPVCDWDSSYTTNRLRIIDARVGEKLFYEAWGRWGIRWYLLPMRSVTDFSAVFDFETRTLVEL